MSNAKKPPSENFSWEEIACNCGCGSRVNARNARAVCKLAEALRQELGGHPLHVTSGHRCAAHNRAVGGAEHSLHLVSGALDVYSLVQDAGRVHKAASRLRQRGVPIGGIGFYRSWVHIDIGPRRDWTG